MSVISNDAQTNTISIMRDARCSPSVILHQYNILRSSNPDKLVMAVEGVDDTIFYEAMVKRYADTLEPNFLPCDGKKAVLDLRKKLKSSKVDEGAVCFLIDHDFDGIRDAVPGSDLYCTPSYSIENIMVSESVLKSLLKGELKCNDKAAADDTERVCDRFQSLLRQYSNAMKDVNLFIFVATKMHIRMALNKSKISDFITISIDSIEPKLTFEAIQTELGIETPITDESLEEHQASFENFKPIENWRGKYLLQFFHKFIDLLIEDRKKSNPDLFNEYKKISFDARQNYIRVFAPLCVAPPCLVKFLKSIPNFKT